MPVHIVVALRLVADLAAEIEIADDGKSIDREWVDNKLNEFDDHALEEALILKDACGGRVTVLALDGEGTERALQSALARGADQALKIPVTSELALSSREAAPLFAAAVQSLGADLFLTGVQTPEDAYGQLAPYVGARLGWPQASAIRSVKIENGAALVEQELGGGLWTTLRLILPAALGIQTASAPIRYVSGSKLRQAIGQRIGEADVRAEPDGPAAELTSLATRRKGGGAIMFSGDVAIVARKIVETLRDRGLLRK